MQEDVFDLKIGNTIYQVDYDHSNGVFTDKKFNDGCLGVILYTILFFLQLFAAIKVNI